MNRRALILLAPSTGGKDTIIQHLAGLGLVHSCQRETSRSALPEELGSYTYVTPEVFLQNMQQGRYVMPNEYAGNYYGIRTSVISNLWENGEFPVLKGPIWTLEDCKKQLIDLAGGNKLILKTVYLFPDDHEMWETMLRKRGFNNADERVTFSRNEMFQASNGHQHLIDFPITNVIGNLPQTVEAVKSIVENMLSS